jgi:hypothetical protein
MLLQKRFEPGHQPANHAERNAGNHDDNGELAEREAHGEKVGRGHASVQLLNVGANVLAAEVVDDHRQASDDHQTEGDPEEHVAQTAVAVLVNTVQPVQLAPADAAIDAVLERLAQQHRQEKQAAEHDVNADEVGEQALVSEQCINQRVEVHRALPGARRRVDRPRPAASMQTGPAIPYPARPGRVKRAWPPLAG